MSPHRGNTRNMNGRNANVAPQVSDQEVYDVEFRLLFICFLSVSPTGIISGFKLMLTQMVDQ